MKGGASCLCLNVSPAMYSSASMPRGVWRVAEQEEGEAMALEESGRGGEKPVGNRPTTRRSFRFFLGAFNQSN